MMAASQFLVVDLVLAALHFAVLKTGGARSGRFNGLVLGALFGLPVIAITLMITSSTVAPILYILWLALCFLAWGYTLSFTYRRLGAIEEAANKIAPPVESPPEAASVERIGRRQFLLHVGTAAATVTVVSGGHGAVLAASERQRQEQVSGESSAPQPDGSNNFRLPNQDDPVIAAPGTRPEYIPIQDHYQVFLQAEPTVLDGATWMLPITGLVDNPLLLTIDELRDNYEPRHQYVTLTCISGRVGTGLIGTTQWTGVSVQDVLADAGLQEGARYLWIQSGDGFYESVDLDLIASDERIMFCYAWDGNTLPNDHGYPLRIWIPDLYGMKQPKWITSIEVVDEDRDGYWVERSWDKVARVKATSVIDTVAVDDIIEDGDERLVPVGGIAYTGDRGVSSVEVRVDGGAWEEAQLRSPLSETTWVIWRYEWAFSPGNHTFEVRCVEADGTRQIEEEADAHPNGSSGIHSCETRL
ncbi:MAG: molybdopterin-dependent oxidoreductase [Anaerolineales bacterium]|nr:molybdopterin-dependent oxidoreductase [Anaerolineales bacterium]